MSLYGIIQRPIWVVTDRNEIVKISQLLNNIMEKLCMSKCEVISNTKEYGSETRTDFRSCFVTRRSRILNARDYDSKATGSAIFFGAQASYDYLSS